MYYYRAPRRATVPQERISLDRCMFCHSWIEVANQTCYLADPKHTDIGLTSPSADPIAPGAWQDIHWSTNVEVTGETRPGNRSVAKEGIKLRFVSLESGASPCIATALPDVPLYLRYGFPQTGDGREITVPVGWALNTNN